MKIKDLIKELKKFNKEDEFIISSDEELNILFNNFQIAKLTNTNQVCIYGLSGSEIEEEDYSKLSLKELEKEINKYSRKKQNE